MKRTGEKKQIVYALLTGFLGFFVYEFLYYFGIAQLTIALKQAGRKANDVTNGNILDYEVEGWELDD